MGNQILDDIFLGYDQTNLMTIAGRAGSKKTWLICYLALLCEKVLLQQDHAADILFITNEMAISQIELRYDAIKYSLPYELLLKGKLSREQTRKYSAALRSPYKSKIVFAENCWTIDEVAAKISI